MNGTKSNSAQGSLSLAAIVYYAVMLVAMVIGLYGLFSLFWLASSAVERGNASRLLF
jgi:hypothetical protein